MRGQIHRRHPMSGSRDRTPSCVPKEQVRGHCELLPNAAARHFGKDCNCSVRAETLMPSSWTNDVSRWSNPTVQLRSESSVQSAGHDRPAREPSLSTPM